MVKNTIFKIMTATLLISTLIYSAAYAAGPIEVYNDSGEISVNVTNLTKSEEATILVVNGDYTILQAFEDTQRVYHIDQTAANSDGVANFSFNITDSGTYKIYSGYATMKNSDKALDAVLDESTPPSPGAKYTLGDVNGDNIVSVSDVTAIVLYISKGTEFNMADNGNEVYEYGRQAADVNFDGAISVSDLTLIVKYITSGTPFEAQ